MKKSRMVKRFMGLLLAMMMMAVMALPAMAAMIKIDDSTEENHTYEVYQIFIGDVSTDGYTLSNVYWGQNGTGTQNLKVSDDILAELEGVKDKTDKEKLRVIEEYANLKSAPFKTVTNTTTTTDVPMGYYLIKDKDGSLTSADAAYTTYIVEILRDTDTLTITPKSEKPTVDKQVLDEEDDAEGGAVDGWGETADHAINERFQFKLIATLPGGVDGARLNDYDKYQITFNDKMSDGVTFVGIDSVDIYRGTNEKPLVSLDPTQYTVAGMPENQAGATWSLTITDLKAIDEVNPDIKNLRIEVIYTAYLNENATVNTPGNDETTNNANTVHLTYSNNPNWGGEGETGKTNEDTVWVFTYLMNNTKVKDDKNNTTDPLPALKGAGFELHEGLKKSEDSDEIVAGAKIELYEESGFYYPMPAKDKTAVNMMVSDDDGKFNIKGLDAGTYVLKEVQTPDGYNTCDDVVIVIESTHDEENASTPKAEITMTQNGTKTGANQIVNVRGTLLPGTGGIGTTIFYVVGGCLVVGAGALLIVKRRISKSKAK